MSTDHNDLRQNLADQTYRRQFITKCFQNPANYTKGEFTNFLHLPWEECARMVSMAKANGGIDGRSFAVHNIEMLDVLRFDAGVPRESITFISDRDDKEAFAAIYGVETLKTSDWFSSDRKWDFTFCLPPFAMNIHIDYMVKSKMSSNIMSCTITPSIWLLTRKSTRRNKKWSAALASLQGQASTVELFNGSDIIGNRFPMPMMRVSIFPGREGSIWLVNHLTGEEFTYQRPEGMDKYGNSPQYHRLLDKIDSALLRYGSIGAKVGKTPAAGAFYVNIASIRGHSIKGVPGLYSPDYFTFLPDDSVVETEPKFQSVGFQTMEQAEIFLKYLRGDFARFFLSVVKNNTHLNRGELRRVPMPDTALLLAGTDVMQQFDLDISDMEFIRSRNILFGETPTHEVYVFPKEETSSMVENNNIPAHFYWFSKKPADPMPEGIPLSVTTFKKFHPEFRTVLHTNLENLPEIAGLDEIRKEELPECPNKKSGPKGWVNLQHPVDYKRLLDAVAEGGVFLDMDFTFIRRLPEEFLRPAGGKVCAYNIYENWHPSFCIASFSVEKKGNAFLKAWIDWYGEDYNTVDFNWNGNFVGGLVENYFPGATKHLGTAPLYDYVPAGKMDWNFRDYYTNPSKVNVCAVHWGTCYVISVKKDEVNAWTSAKHFTETGMFLEDFAETGKSLVGLDFSAQSSRTYRCHVYVMKDEDLTEELQKFVEDKIQKHGLVLVHCNDIIKASEILPGQEVSADMDVQTCFKKAGGIHMIYRKTEAKK